MVCKKASISVAISLLGTVSGLTKAADVLDAILTGTDITKKGVDDWLDGVELDDGTIYCTECGEEVWV